MRRWLAAAAEKRPLTKLACLKLLCKLFLKMQRHVLRALLQVAASGEPSERAWEPREAAQ